MPLQTFKCSLCRRNFYGFGNNPYPLCDREDYKAKCCDKCNFTKVLPARMVGMGALKKKVAPVAPPPPAPAPSPALVAECEKMAEFRKQIDGDDDEDKYGGWVKVDWDIGEGEEVAVPPPTRIKLPHPMKEDDIASWLSDHYGWCCSWSKTD